MHRIPASRRWAIFLISMTLIGAAAWTLFHQGPALAHAWSLLRTAPTWLVLLAFTLPLLNLTAVSLSFSIMIARYGRVPFSEMFPLLCAAWLLNLFPMRPGLIGRATYHRLVNHIPIWKSAKAYALVMLSALCALSILSVTAFLALKAATFVALIATMLVPIPLLAAAAFALQGSPTRPHIWRWPACIACRYTDMIVWTLRYGVVFSLLGKTLPVSKLAVVAIASEIAMLSPFQLGLRQWVVQLVFTRLQSSGWHLTRHEFTGLLADVLNLGIDVSLAVPLGLIAIWWLYRRVRATKRHPVATSEPVGRMT